MLKVGILVMLLRNLDPSNGLCNGTRLIIRHCLIRLIEAEVLTGDRAGHVTFIPQIPLISANAGLPYCICRKQFPIRVAYAMTINKSQGQMLPKVGIHIMKDVFLHGQLYIAFFHAMAPKNVSVLLQDKLHGDY